MTAKERMIIAAAAATGEDPAEVARRAGVTLQGAYQAMKRPAIQDAIRREQQARLFNEVLPLAIEAHLRLLTDPGTPAGARAQAVGLAYKHALPGAELERKDPAEMTPDELQALASQAKARLAELAAQAKPIIDQSSGDVFE